MSVLPSLIAALERAAGESLVLRSGQRPHVIAGDVRHDVGTTVLSVKAVEALAGQILSPSGLKEFAERSTTHEVLSVEVPDGSLTVRAERVGEEMHVELRRHRRSGKPADVPAEAPPVEPASATPPAEPRSETPSTTPSTPSSEAPAATETPVAAKPAGTEPVTPAASAEPQPVPDPAVAGDHVKALEVVEHTLTAQAIVGADAAEPSGAASSPEPPTPAGAVTAHVAAPVATVDTEEPPTAPAVNEPIAQSEQPTPAEPALPPSPPPAPVFVRAHQPADPPVFHGDAPRLPESGTREEDLSSSAACERHDGTRPKERTNSRDLSERREPKRSSSRSEPRPEVTLDPLIRAAIERGATAIYVRAGQAPSARIDERLQPVGVPPLSAEEIQTVVAACEAGTDGWSRGEDCEWVRHFDLAGQVRCYPFADHAGAGLVVHLTPRRSAAGAQKHVPRQVRRVCEAEDGLLLVAAASQPELMTMIGAVADLSARARAGYVICLEPATGLPFTAESAFISERQVSGSGEEVAATVRRAAQEGPDVLVAGPVSSGPALEEVLRAATAPGRLVILGIVAATALQGIESILAGVTRERTSEARAALASGLRAAFGVRGLRRVGGGRATVQDVLVGTSEVRALLQRGDFAGLEQLQREGAEGMRTLDAALARAVARKQVTLRHAARYAASRSELVALMRKDARERRRITRDHRGTDRRPGVLRAITAG